MASLATIADLLDEIQEIYPNWKATAETAKRWAKYLADFDDDILKNALEFFIKNSGSPFAPELPVIIKIARELEEKEDRQKPWTGLQTPFAQAIENKTYVPKPPRPETPQPQA
jgi:hypothetical protein